MIVCSTVCVCKHWKNAKGKMMFLVVYGNSAGKAVVMLYSRREKRKIIIN